MSFSVETDFRFKQCGKAAPINTWSFYGVLMRFYFLSQVSIMCVLSEPNKK